MAIDTEGPKQAGKEYEMHKSKKPAVDVSAIREAAEVEEEEESKKPPH